MQTGSELSIFDPIFNRLSTAVLFTILLVVCCQTPTANGQQRKPPKPSGGPVPPRVPELVL
jgi:hypothetical protein